jgi:pyruvate dehydrogenase complex dehydrogenase (E1) component
MNRRDRRKYGKTIYDRINVLKGSRILNDPYLKDLTEEDIKILKEGTHENKSLQEKFKKASVLATELFMLQSKLFEMNKDLESKKNIVNVN